MDIILQKYTEAIDNVAFLRTQIVDAQSRLEEYAYKLSIAKAKAERKTIESKSADGNKKPLGSNADDRAREIILALSSDDEYEDVRKKHATLQTNVSRLKADKESAEEKLGLIKLESDAHLREALKEVIKAFTTMVSGSVAETLIGNETMRRNGI